MGVHISRGLQSISEYKGMLTTFAFYEPPPTCYRNVTRGVSPALFTTARWNSMHKSAFTRSTVKSWLWLDGLLILQRSDTESPRNFEISPRFSKLLSIRNYNHRVFIYLYFNCKDTRLRILRIEITFFQNKIERNHNWIMKLFVIKKFNYSSILVRCLYYYYYFAS